jgi:hypothetical protein
VSVFGRWSGVAAGQYQLENNDTQIRFVPSKTFSAGEWVTVSISKGVMSQAGQSMSFGFAWNFWIKTEPGTLDLQEIARIPIREPGEGHIQSYGAYAGDLNEDGYTDFAVPNELSNDVRVFLNDGTGGYGSFTIFPIPNGDFASTNEGEDLNNDGHIDLAVGNGGSDSVTVYIGDGAGGFSSTRNYQASMNVRGLSVMDLDGDGDVDIVTANRGGNNLSILLNNGNGTFAPRVNMEANGLNETACAVADANGDGILDLFVGAQSSNEMILLLGDGVGGLVYSTKVNAGGRPWMTAAGDVNGDGYADVVSANSFSNNASVILGDGQGQLAPAVTYPVGNFALAIDLGDIDGDGDLDLVTSNYNSRDWTIYENAGDGTFTNPRTLQAVNAGSCATLHDRDNDGDLDMTGIDEIDDLIFLFDNNPAVNVEEGLIVPRRISLHQNYPNPFNPITVISYSVPTRADIVVKIYNSLGQEIRTLIEDNQPIGHESVVWDGKDDLGREVSSGTYVYRLIAGNNTQSRKMLLLR